MGDFPKIPGYTIEKELGQGGMARVYLAMEEKLERKVALKVLLPGLTDDAKLIERFIKEAKTSAKLNHPNIIHIYDVGKEKGNIYMAMEYIEGGSLKERIEQGNLGIEEIERIVSLIAEALEYSHNKGVIHRDIKPDNILFHPDGRPVVVDFGIAKAVDSNTKLTKTGMSIGTPHYMSPEQGRGEKIDRRSDIYSLGVVLFEMITGKQPYDAENTVGVVIKHIQEPIPKLAKSIQPSAISQFKNEELEKLQALINKMMAKKPEGRAQSGREVMELIHKETGDRRQEIGEGNEPSTEYVGLNNNSPSPAIGAQQSMSVNAKVSDKLRKTQEFEAEQSMDSHQSIYETISAEEARQILNDMDEEDLEDNSKKRVFILKEINGDKIVIDNLFDLIWHQSGSKKYMDFNDAEEWIRDLNRRGYAGYSDWRLPTLKEAASILESSEINGDLYIDPIFSDEQCWIWTGDKNMLLWWERVWIVNFIEGNFSKNILQDLNYIRPVRYRR